MSTIISKPVGSDFTVRAPRDYGDLSQSETPQAVLDYMLEHGVPLRQAQLWYNRVYIPNQCDRTLYYRLMKK